MKLELPIACTEETETSVRRYTRIMTLTTDHSASSYGVPALVDSDGNCYGPADVVPGTRRTAKQCVEIAEGGYEEVPPESDRIISEFVGRKAWSSQNA